MTTGCKRTREDEPIETRDYFIRIKPYHVYDFAFICYQNGLKVVENDHLDKENALAILYSNLNRITQSLSYFLDYFRMHLADNNFDVINKKKMNFSNKYSELYSFRNVIAQKILDLETKP